MQVKTIYVDLKECRQEERRGKNVWILESEAFKEPIEIDIQMDDKDIKYMESKKEEVECQLNRANQLVKNLEEKLELREEKSKKILEESQKKDQKIIELGKQLVASEQEKIKLQKGLENVKKMIDSHNDLLEGVEKLINEIKKKVTKESRVFSGQTFVSGNGMSALTALRVPDGNYVVIWMTQIVEKNEYVENEDHEVGAFNVHVQDGIFTPEYDLKGTTQLDTPTATINRTFIMIPN